MESVKALVDQLQQQLLQAADTQTLLATVRAIQETLSGLPDAQPPVAPPVTPGRKVAVVMPAGAPRPVVIPVASAEPEEEPTEPAREKEEVAAKEKPAEVLPQQTDWLHSLMQEIPTLAHQKEFRELNEVLHLQGSPSLNDKLKQASVEVAEVLTREPVRDLKKAIGVNDRFVFVNELFRGDEVMYERSIKTINSFNVLQEAEFWMERELKLKLGWDDSKETVRHFLQLVRRRFSSK